MLMFILRSSFLAHICTRPMFSRYPLKILGLRFFPVISNKGNAPPLKKKMKKRVGW